jgi:glycosyltransferase involved in cell wall biosynthesis
MQFHVLSFEGPDSYAYAGGLASRITGLVYALAEAGYETHLWFVALVRGRTIVSKVARWDPSKRWLLAIDTVGAMKRVGWQPLLIARGRVEPHGAEVLSAAAANGLRVADRLFPQRGARGLMQVLEGLHGVDIINLCSPLDPESRLVLFHSSAAILANSQQEPFRLVGLETMAAGGVACIGYTGEDYAGPGHSALTLETDDPQEFLDLFGTLRVNPSLERALRRAGRTTAQQYTWPQIMHRILLPRLGLIAGSAVSSSLKAIERQLRSFRTLERIESGNG